MSYISEPSHAYAFRGVPTLVKAKYFLGGVTKDPFNAGISLRILVSTKKILGTRAGTFSPREKIVHLCH